MWRPSSVTGSDTELTSLWSTLAVGLLVFPPSHSFWAKSNNLKSVSAPLAFQGPAPWAATRQSRRDARPQHSSANRRRKARLGRCSYWFLHLTHCLRKCSQPHASPLTAVQGAHRSMWAARRALSPCWSSSGKLLAVSPSHARIAALLRGLQRPDVSSTPEDLGQWVGNTAAGWVQISALVVEIITEGLR